MKRTIFIYTLAIFILFSARLVLADDFTVSTSAELQAALTEAQSNGEDDVIHLNAGTYPVSQSGGTLPWFTYLPPETETNSLTLIGAGADVTILDGENSMRVMNIGKDDSEQDEFLVNSGTITVQKITFRNGNIGTGNNSGRTIGAGLFILADGSSIRIEDCRFINNKVSGGRGGGLSVIGGYITVALDRNTFEGNSASSVGGGLMAAFNSGSITLKQNQFIENGVKSSGGGVYIDTDLGAVNLNSNIFKKNSAENSSFGSGIGGGIWVRSIAAPHNWLLAENNIFSGNRGNSGGGAWIESFNGEVSILHNTLTNNEATARKGGGLVVALYNVASKAKLVNNIVFGNHAVLAGKDIFLLDTNFFNNAGLSADLFNNDFSDLLIECPEVGGCPSLNVNQVDNINADPLFVNADQGDFHLQAGSPAVDQGSATILSLPAIDFEGNDRVVGAARDIGAYESSSFPVPSPTSPPGNQDQNSSSGGCRLSASQKTSQPTNERLTSFQLLFGLFGAITLLRCIYSLNSANILQKSAPCSTASSKALCE